MVVWHPRYDSDELGDKGQEAWRTTVHVVTESNITMQYHLLEQQQETILMLISFVCLICLHIFGKLNHSPF